MSYSTIHHNPTRLPKSQYSTANRVQEIHAQHNNSESYLQVTQARMEREKQLRIETSRRRRAQKRKKKQMARREEDQRERKLKERLQKKTEYVNYVRKHLTKVISHPYGGTVRRRTNRGSRTNPSSSASNSSLRPNRAEQQRIVPRGSSQSSTPSLVEFEKIPITAAHGPVVGSGTTPTPAQAGHQAGHQAGQLLKDLRNQMKRNEKLRCSIEALDLQVHIHSSNSQQHFQVEEVPENIMDGGRNRTQSNNAPSLSSDDEAEDAEQAPEIIEDNVVGYDNDSMDEEEEGVCVSPSSSPCHRNNNNNNNNKENVSTSPMCSPSRQKSGDTSTPRPPPPQPPLQSPSSVRIRVGKSPTWARNLDPAPTKMFDSLDLSMSLRQSIEIDRNRARSTGNGGGAVAHGALVEVHSVVEQDPRAWTPKHNRQQQQSSSSRRTAAAVETTTPVETSPVVGQAPLSHLSPPSIRRVSGTTSQQQQQQQQQQPAAPSKANALTPDSRMNDPPVPPKPSQPSSASSPSNTAAFVPITTTAPYFETPSNNGYLAMRQKALVRKKQMETQKKRTRRQHHASGLLEEESTMKLQQRSSWGRDLSNLTPKRRARREAAMRRKEYEKMINLQMKEDRLQRRRLLQQKRDRRLEEESLMLQNIQYQRQQSQQEQQQQCNVALVPTFSDQQSYHQQQQYQPQQPQQQQLEAPPPPPYQQQQQQQQQHMDSPLRPLGRDYHHRTRLGDIDPRSTISLEEDRLRGSLMRLEQRLDQTRRKSNRTIGSSKKKKTLNRLNQGIPKRNRLQIGGGSILRNQHGTGSNRGDHNTMTMLPPARLASHNNNNRRYHTSSNNNTKNSNNAGHQQQFIIEEQHSHGILRYPVAQRTTAGHINNNNTTIAPPNDFSQTTSQNRASGRYTNTPQPVQQPQHQHHHPQHQHHQPQQHHQPHQQVNIQPPTTVHVIPGNDRVPAEVTLSYAVQPRIATAPTGTTMGTLNSTGTNVNGYFGLQATRQETHMQRVVRMGQQQLQTTRAQSAVPAMRKNTMRVITSTRKVPKGSLQQKPRTRRIKLGKNKVRTGGLSGQVHVNTNKLHLLLSE